MDSRSKNIERTALIKTHLKSCDVSLKNTSSAKEMLDMTVGVNITIGLVLDDTKAKEANKFIVEFKLSLAGFEKESKNTDNLFHLNCVFFSHYETTNKNKIKIEEINKDLEKYGEQIYPLARNYVIQTMLYMDINPGRMPWGFGKSSEIKDDAANVS